MHFVFEQSLFKFSILKCSNFSPARCYSTRQKSSKNHYDTLKITPHATQNEVKTAYYKLTLQYHPDKNQSEYAKQKFQDISEAYEVLSNHELRKNYDRRMMLYQQPADEKSMPQYKDKVYSGTSKIYNFDAWTQAHYGRQMYASRIRKQVYEEYIKMEEIKTRQKNEAGYAEYALLFFTIAIIALCCRQKSHDVPASKKNKAEDKKSSSD